MAVLIITTKPAFLPDPDDLCGWEFTEDGEFEVFHKKVGPHELFAAECMTDVAKKQKIKHEKLARLVRFVKNRLSGIPDTEIYLIAHDKDVLKGSGSDEGVYPESNVRETGSSLAGMILDRHIYIFQHVAQQDMFELLVKNLLDGPDEAAVEAAVRLINGYAYETPAS